MIIGGTSSELFALLEKSNELAFDVETTGVNRRKDTCIGFGIAAKISSNPERYAGYYIVTHTYDATSNELRTTASLEIAKQVLAILSTKKLITWNGAFDTSIALSSYGVDLVKALYCDGMLLAHTVDENQFDYKLKGIAKRVFGAKAVAEEDDLKAEVKALGGSWTNENKEMFKATPETLGKYCIADCVLTLRLKDYFEPKLAAQDLTKFFYDDETMPLYRHFTIPAERNGIRLDMELLQKAQSDIAIDIAKLQTQILSEIQPSLSVWKSWLLNKDYPPSRTGAFAQMFCQYKALDLPKTASGKFSLAVAHIDALPESYEKRVLQQSELMTSDDVAAVQELMWTEDGCPGFNLQSKHHLKKLFFDTLKETPLSRTPTGQPQADDDFLDSMVHKYSWAKLLQVYNRLNKLKSTYMDRFLDAQENGRFYPSFQQHRTISGRLAGDLQQLPRPVEHPSPDDVVAKYRNLIRAFFIADEGCVLIDDDYESAEPRVFAHASGEQNLKNIFALGHDFYSTICIQTEKVANVSADKKAPNYLGKVMKEKRQSAKVYSLGIPYGLTGYKLQFELNIPLDQADAIVKGYLAGFPNLANEMKKAHKEALELGFVRNEAGRIRHLQRAKELYAKYGQVILDDLELWKKFHEMPGLYAQAKIHRRELKNLLNNAFNFKVQGLVANIINRATIATAKAYEAAGLKSQIIANIHDELIVHAPESEAKQAAQILQQCMESAWPLSVPMIATPSFGQNFRDAKGA